MNGDQTIKLAVETLMEVVESAKNLEVCVMYPNNKHEILDEGVVDQIVKQIEKEREEANEQK